MNEDCKYKYLLRLVGKGEKMSQNKKIISNKHLIVFSSVIAFFVIFQNCSPSDINERFQTAVNKSNSNSNQNGNQQQSQEIPADSNAQKVNYSLLKNKLKVSEVAISDLYEAQIEFDRDYNNPLISVVNLSTTTSCPTSTSRYMSLLDIENSSFVGKNGARYAWKHQDVSNVFRDMFLSLSGVSAINIMVCFLSEKNVSPIKIGQFSIKLKSTQSEPVIPGTTSAVTNVNCPSTGAQIDNWPFTVAGTTWIRSFEVSGLAMKLSHTQLTSITSGLAFRMSGDGGGYGGSISLCPGDLKGGAPAAVYFKVANPSSGVKVGDPCVSTAGNLIYMTEAGAREKISKTPSFYQNICVLKKSDYYYINYPPRADAKPDSKAQFWFLVSF